MATQPVPAEAGPLGSTRNVSLRALFVCREPHPSYRADVAVLIGKYLPRFGIRSDMVALDAGQVHGEGVPWPAGKTLTTRARASRARNLVAFFLDASRRMLFARDGDYDLIIVRDNPLLAAIALAAGRRLAIPVAYWMSFPIPEGNLVFAASGWRRIGLARWLFAKIKGHMGAGLLYGAVCPRVAHVFVQSPHMAKWLRNKGVRTRGMTPVPMGVDMEEIASAEIVPMTDERLSDRTVVVHIGSFDPARRVDFLIRALKEIRRVVPDILLVMVGDTSEPDEEVRLRSLVRELDLEQNVLWAGWMPMKEAWRYVRAARLGFSCIPRGELYDCSSPTKLVEYLALGVPAVANDLPDQVDVANQSGAVRIEEMTPEGIARGAIAILGSPKEAEEMARRGVEFVRNARSYAVLGEAVARQIRELVRDGGSRRWNADIECPRPSDRSGGGE